MSAALLRPARAAEDRAAVLVEIADEIGREVDRRVVILLDEALVAVGDAVDGPDAVAVVERHDQAANDVVEAGTKAAAGDHRANGTGRMKEYFLARAGVFDRDRLDTGFHGLAYFSPANG